MKNEQNQEVAEKKKLAVLIGTSVLALAILVTVGSYVLSKISPSTASGGAGNQEQFAGQAETSQHLQSECQGSAQIIGGMENVSQAVVEFKKHVENCKEVYFTIDDKAKIRNEGMYPDIVVDLITKLSKSSKKDSLELLEYAKQLPSWQFYMGPIVCDSKAVLDSYEESLKDEDNKICIKREEFAEKILNPLQAKDFSILKHSMSAGGVAWLGSPEADVGCPEKMSTIIKTIQAAAAKGLNVSDAKTDDSNQSPLSVVFRGKGDGEGLVLDFLDDNGCVQLKAALVSGLQTNE